MRVPDWVDKRAVVLQVDGGSKQPQWAGAYVKVDSLKPRQTVTLIYPQRQVTRSERMGRRQYRVTWKGDTVIDQAGRRPLAARPYLPTLPAATLSKQ